MLTQWLLNVVVPAQDPTLSSSSEAAITAGGQHSRGLHPSARIVELIADRLLDFGCPSSSGSSTIVVSSSIENDQEVDDKEAVVTQEEIATKIITSSSYDDDDDDGGEERGADDNDHLRIISLAEVGRHADNDDAWMVIYDKVK